MSGSGLKYAALAAVVLAVVLGVLAWRATIQATEAAKQEALAQARAQQPAAPEPQALAVVALRPLAANRPVPAEAVAVKPLSVTPDRYYTAVEDVVGRVPLLDVDAGAPVTPRYFKESNVLARLIPEGHRALSLEVSDVIAVGGFVRPGDRVDMLLYLRDQQQQAQSRVLLPDALVLAYEERIIERPEGLDDEGPGRTQRGRLRTAVVAVPEDQLTRVMLGANVGDLRLALRRQAPDLAEREGTLPVGAPSPTPAVAVEQPITLAELARIPTPTPTRAPRPQAYTVDVFRGGDVSREAAR